MYLGTKHTPENYYEREGHSYSNPHKDRICSILEHFKPHIEGLVLDLGCGDGLISKWIAGRWAAVGLESSDTMATRYMAETNLPCFIQPFWEQYPRCDTIIASYCLHLCPRSRIHELRFALQTSQANKLIVISPLKSIRSLLHFPILADISVTKPKTTYGWVFKL